VYGYYIILLRVQIFKMSRVTLVREDDTLQYVIYIFQLDLFCN